MTAAELSLLRTLVVHHGLDAIVKAAERFGMAQSPDAPASGAARLELLTPRELEAFCLYSRGLPIKVIARDTGMSINNVKVRFQSMREKLGRFNRVQAAEMMRASSKAVQ